MRRLAIALVAALALAAGCDKPDLTNTGVLGNKMPTETITLSPDQVLQEFKANPVRAEEMVKNKRVRMTGTLLSITSINGDDKSVGLSLATSDTSGLWPSIMMFKFDASHRSEVAALNPKQTITLEGVYVHKSEFGKGHMFDGLAIIK